tara:strand:- start:1191 stop:1904 length:714 start_codon:yes stop_codon:yes gene_type:complete
MWDMKSVYFNRNVALRDLDQKDPEFVFDAWLERIREYYVTESELSDERENGFASMVLQLCAVDALASFIPPERSLLEEMSKYRKNPPQGSELKIRTFLYLMLERNQTNKAADSRTAEGELLEATAHLYFQYRCGLVHNGFTLQVGEYAKNNSPERLFLMSYQTYDALITNLIQDPTSAFIVNPKLFRLMLNNKIGEAEKLSSEVKKKIGEEIQNVLSAEIRIAKQLPLPANIRSQCD